MNPLTRDEMIDFCLKLGGTGCDFPFELDNNYCVARHSRSRKWFALIYCRNGELYINVKCDPMEAEFLRDTYRDVTPGYHMNKTHWNTIRIGGDVPREIICSMLETSYGLTAPKGKNVYAYYVYLMRCGDGSLYCGSTNDVKRREMVHNSGKGAKYTRSRLPVTLVYSEGFPDKSEALKREAAIKRFSKEEKTALIGAKAL